MRPWRKLLAGEPVDEAAHGDCKTDLAAHQGQFWQEGWQAVPAAPVPRTAKLLALMSTRPKGDAVELAQTSFQRWNCQEKILGDCFLPLHLDTNHGDAKEQVVNWELAKRQGVAAVASATPATGGASLPSAVRPTQAPG